MLFLIAFSARFLFATLAFPLAVTYAGLNKGSDGYERIAQNLIEGHGFRVFPDSAPTTLRVPMYPLFLAGIYAVFGGRLWVVQIFQSVLGGVTTVVVAIIALRFFGTRPAWLAGLAYAFYPGDLVACSRYLTEPLAILFLMLAVVCFERVRCRPTAAGGALLGLLIGLAAGTQNAFAFLLPVYCMALFLSREFRGQWKRGVAAMAAAGVVCVAVVAPWTWRAFELTGHFVYPSTLGGHAVHDGYVVAEGLSSGEPVHALLERARKIARTMARENGLEFHPRDRFSWVMYTAEDEYALDRLLKAKVLGLTVQDPVGAGERALMGLARFWYLGRTTRATWVGALIHVPLLVLAAIGAIRAIQMGADGVWLWVAIIGYFNVISGIILPLVRYATPVMPFVVILAASLAVRRRRGVEARSDIRHRAIYATSRPGDRDLLMEGGATMTSPSAIFGTWVP